MNIIRKLFGPAVSKIIMPAQKKEDLYGPVRAIQRDGNVNILNHFISAPKASINIAEFTSAPEVPITHKKIVIFSVGNNGNYEQYFYDYVNLARENPHWHIVGFNYRNVLASKGKAESEQDWINDAKSVILHFRNQGCENENILLCGHSLGGAIVTMAASQLYQEDQHAAKTNGKNPAGVKCVRCINDRSFSNLSEEIVISLLGHTRSSIINAVIFGVLVASISLLWVFCFPAIGGLTILSSLNLAGITAGAVLGVSLLKDTIAYALVRPWVTMLADLTFGRMDALSQYQKIPEESKSYLIAKNDSVVKKAAS
ncbi:MAG TPA: alpha/beta hydrolase, partial [Gammaproteobacteria bacterium]|nr:alpha/beta hydrolase [Gammaproteobacteria bacterium]